MPDTKRKKPAKPWSAEKYRIAIQGDELPGLRSTVEGFNAKDGYDLRHIDSWTPSKKRRVRDYYEKVHHLLAQEKRIVRPRNKRNLRTLQDSFHGDIASKQFKVAFVPYTDPKQLHAKRSGLKSRPARIRYTKRGIVFDTGAYARHFESFDKKRLAKNSDDEVKRAIAAMPGTKLFFVQVGQFQTLNGMGPNIIRELIKKWMMQYDGRKQLPNSSGNRGDAPKHHRWQLWLEGIVGYSFPKSTDTNQMQRAITSGMKAAKARRAKQDAEIRRKSRKKK